MNRIKAGGILAVAALIAAAGIAYTNQAHADNVDYTVNVADSLNVTVSSSSVVLDLNPNTKTSDSQDITVTVGTNNITGYKLNMSSTGDITSLTRDSSVDGIAASIPTLSAEAGATASSLSDNTWGYRLNNTGNFVPYVSGVQIMEKNVATNADTATLSFASKINYNQSAGSYAINLIFTGTVNPLCDNTIDGDMQTFDPCPDMAIGTSGTLKDLRDNKVYTVAKLADGQIWMTSNLNLAGGTKLYSETSNVPAGYPESAGVGYYTLPASSSSGFSSDTVAYVYNTGNETTTQTSAANNSYYSWLAATAGGKDASGTAVTDNGYNAAYSICPKGWRLPTATTEGVPRDSGGYTGGDFYKMTLAVKGVTSLPNGYYADPDSTPTFNTNAGPGTLPNFLLAGFYVSSSFYYGGANGYYWSSSSNSSTGAYYLLFLSSYVYSAFNNYRRHGFSVRCVFAGS
ncbi:hypothetical protein IJG92_03640 [Candidatus Saccharibacteria bacterium]|nr:hypothetical protein [Candidatus Saccharibacteria bacterium]